MTGNLYVSRNLSISSRLFNLLVYNYSYSLFLMIHYISVVSVVILLMKFLFKYNLHYFKFYSPSYSLRCFNITLAFWSILYIFSPFVT